MDSFLDMLFDHLKALEGRLVPRGWSAGLAAGTVIVLGVLITILAFVLIRE